VRGQDSFHDAPVFVEQQSTHTDHLCEGRGRFVRGGEGMCECGVLMSVGVCLAGMRMGWGKGREVEILRGKEKYGWKRVKVQAKRI
jgi:hypothetical protein